MRLQIAALIGSLDDTLVDEVHVEELKALKQADRSLERFLRITRRVNDSRSREIIHTLGNSALFAVKILGP